VKRPLLAIAVAAVWLVGSGVASASEPAIGVAVTSGDVAELPRIRDAGADVAFIRVRSEDVGEGAATVMGGEAAAAGLPAIVRLTAPRGASPESWRALAAGAAERLAAARAQVRAWVVRDATASDVSAVRDGLGEEASILAMVRGSSASPRRAQGADGVMFDPRARTPAELIASTRRLRAVLPGGSALWVGPIGWSSQRHGAHGWASGLRGQRVKLIRALRGLEGGRLGVEGVVWSRWRDRAGAHGFGLVRRGGRAKPSLRAFRRIAGGAGDAGPTEPATVAPDLSVGVAPAETPTDADLDAMRGAGVEVVRFSVSREVVDPDHDGAYDWSSVDREFLSAALVGAEPLPTLIDAPELGGEVDEPGELAQWGRFVAAAVGRYGAGGELWSSGSGPAAIPGTWQVWNEQNAPAFWRPRPVPGDYADLLAVSARRIRAADPDAQVMLGGMFGDPLNDRGIDADAFLTDLYDAGAADSFDVVAANPYAADVAGVAAQLDALRAVSLAAGDRDVEMWITELGWSSVPDPRPQWAGYSRTPEGQAEMLASVGSRVLAGAADWNLRGFVWYTWRDPVVSVCPFCLNAGLLEADGTPKPALSSFAVLAASGP